MVVEAGPTKWETPGWRDCWVLLVDIMGFAERITHETKSKELATLYEKLVSSLVRVTPSPMVSPEEVFNEVPSPAQQAWSRRLKIFSDSIFMFFDAKDSDGGVANPSSLGMYANAIHGQLWYSRLPHRGAIAFGACYINDAQSVFLGRPIVRAHRWEQAQEWLGISVEPSSLTAFEAIKRDPWFFRCPIPTKGGMVSSQMVCLRDRRVAPAAFHEEYLVARSSGQLEVLAKYHRTAQLWIASGDNADDIVKVGGSTS